MLQRERRHDLDNPVGPGVVEVTLSVLLDIIGAASSQVIKPRADRWTSPLLKYLSTMERDALF